MHVRTHWRCILAPVLVNQASSACLSACLPGSRARPLARLRKSSMRAWAAQGDESGRDLTARRTIYAVDEKGWLVLWLLWWTLCASCVVCVWKVRKKFLNKCICMHVCVSVLCVCICVQHMHTHCFLAYSHTHTVESENMKWNACIAN